MWIHFTFGKGTHSYFCMYSFLMIWFCVLFRWTLSMILMKWCNFRSLLELMPNYRSEESKGHWNACIENFDKSNKMRKFAGNNKLLCELWFNRLFKQTDDVCIKSNDRHLRIFNGNKHETCPAHCWCSSSCLQALHNCVLDDTTSLN